MVIALGGQDLARQRDALVLTATPIGGALMNRLISSGDTHLVNFVLTLRGILRLQGKDVKRVAIILLSMGPGRLVWSPLQKCLCLDRIMLI
jgi:hypothetical protein